jgi:hypothetical protein
MTNAPTHSYAFTGERWGRRRGMMMMMMMELMVMMVMMMEMMMLDTGLDVLTQIMDMYIHTCIRIYRGAGA